LAIGRKGDEVKETSVSIVIATLDRRDDLRDTLLELEKLDPPPLEILICLDGCTDGSAKMLQEFPSVAVIENERPYGSVYSRDRLFRISRGDLIVSLDDDSFPMQRDFVARLTKLADERPEVGVFAFEEMRPAGKDDRPFKRPIEESYIASYPNCAGAIRAKLYGAAASYPVFFFHMYEEPDFCLQTYANGYVVQQIPSIKILHRYTHVGRNMIGRHHQHARNELLSVLIRCPFPHVFWVASYRILRQLIFAASNGINWVIHEPSWWWRALLGSRKALAQRRPVPWNIYWNWMCLARRPITSANELATRFSGIKIADEFLACDEEKK
jgi:GT2 family glycosyltransferase